ncbi:MULTISPECIES: hypothetical protein [unclassified Nocardia]|uniref:hypothetical protein n=1 Tax=unclassified Nocardia TaxID=2637762 RepID=UPI001CE43843|nr:MULTISPECIES: hypothetical protein [unclassified Nocardia]
MTTSPVVHPDGDTETINFPAHDSSAAKNQRMHCTRVAAVDPTDDQVVDLLTQLWLRTVFLTV